VQSRDKHYAQAEALYKRALELQVQALGPEHVAVASTLTELAELYASQQLYAKAKPLYSRAFRIQPTHVF
jgi:tetratricopeptide (TPR) repeat protein